MRMVMALFLFVHGFAHLVGFAGSFRLAESIPYSTTLLGHRLDVGDVGIRIVGVFWLLTGLAFAVAAIGAWTRAPWWSAYTLYVSIVSLVMCIASLPEAKIGAFVDVALIVLLSGAMKTGFFVGARF